jgi:stalled ribosome rescue protein Dom34
MSAYVICIDLNEAKLFSLEPGHKQTEIVRRKEIKHHTHADRENHKNLHKYFQDVADHLKQVQELLVVGPGQVKNQFSNHLKETYPHTLGLAIIGVETLDHPTDNQILDFSRKFFRQHDSSKYPVA